MNNLCATVLSFFVAIVVSSASVLTAARVTSTTEGGTATFRNDSISVANNDDDHLTEFSDHTVPATYHYYRPKSCGWDMMASGAYCSTWYADKPLSWRSRHGWTAYCRPTGKPLGQKVCGRCLRVTNLSTGASIVARIVDQCTKPDGGLDLDYDTVFRKIDTDGDGVTQGHLQVKFTFVSCS